MASRCPHKPGATAALARLGLPLLWALASCTSRPPATTEPRPKGEGASAASASGAGSSGPAASPAGSILVDAVAQASPYASAPAGPAVSLDEGHVVDGAALRARHRARLSKTSPVVVLTGGTAEELGERLCREVVPVRPPSTPVLLKPNIGGFQSRLDPKVPGGDDGLRGRITQPAFVRGVVRCLKARGHTRITVADSYGGSAAKWQALMVASGYDAMARAEGVRLVAMSDDGVADKEGDHAGAPLRISGLEGTHVPTLRMPKVLAEHLQDGLFLSLPKIKTHRFSVVSLGIKGMQGAVMLADKKPAYQQKSLMHRELNAYASALGPGASGDRAAYVAALLAFSERMVDVLELEAPDAVLAEGAPAVWGDGFDKLWPGPESVAIGGENTVLVDRVGAEYLGLFQNKSLAAKLGGHATSPLIELAARRFGLDLGSPELRGDGVARIAAHPPTHFLSMAPFELHDNAQPPSLPPALMP